jgi:hypothetical protein
MESARAGFHKILSDILRRAPAEDAALIAWRLVAGSAVDARTTALDFRHGVLRVQVPDADWRANLEPFVPKYLDAVNEMINGKVERIVFVLPAESKAQPA